MTKQKSLVLWIVSIVLMLIVAFFQRVTGPTHPISGDKDVNGVKVHYFLPRSQEIKSNAKINIHAPDNSVIGLLSYKRFKSNDEWTYSILSRKGDFLKGELPEQPPAGKVMYKVDLVSQGQKVSLTKEPILVRFKGVVPMAVLWPHILLIFVALSLSFRTGFEAYFKGNQTNKYTLYTVIALALGGFVFGPLMQYYAFGALWTGWPYGHDLTDNKTAVAVIMWIVALWQIRKNPANTKWVVAASIVLLIAYLIPHSVLGSEVDYTKLPK